MTESKSVPSALNLGAIVMGLLASGVLVGALAGPSIPLLGNLRLSLVAFVVLGMTMCALGGIGRVAATGRWMHPLAIAGYVLGALILVVTGATLAGLRLPYVSSDRAALLAVAGLATAKVVISVGHHALVRRGRIDRGLRRRRSRALDAGVEVPR